MLTVEIDELTPCLKDNMTGAIIETEVIRIKRISFLKNYNDFQLLTSILFFQKVNCINTYVICNFLYFLFCY